jgi:hypothetical protein
MPLNLIEIKSLIGALGVKIPDDILEQKAKAEEFEERQEKISAQASGKAVEWYLKAKYDTAFKAAEEAAGKKQFDAALKQLDECERLLKEPDLAPEVVAALKQLEERKKACEAEIARVKALDSPIGGEVKAGLEAVSTALKDFDAKTAEKHIAEIEKSVKAYAEKKAAEEAALLAARARVDELKKKVAKELQEADAAIKAIGEPTLAAPEEQKLEALTKKQTAAIGVSDLEQQEKDLATLVTEIDTLKKDAAAAKLKADQLNATKLRVTQKLAAVDTALTDLQNVVSGIKEKALKDVVTPSITPLTQERTRIGTLTVPGDQETALSKLETDIAKVKKEVDARVLWDNWLKDTWEVWAKAAKDWIGVIKEQAAKNTLQGQLDAVVQEQAGFLTNNRLGDMEKTSFPKVEKIYEAANRISEHSPEVDLDLHKLRNLVIAVRDGVPDDSVTQPITQTFDGLFNEKKQTWPGGSNATAMIATMNNFDTRIANLRKDTEDARGDFVGGDLASRAKEIKRISGTMAEIDKMLSECEKQDWKQIAKLPPEESAPLLKMKADFEAARKTYKSLQPRVKKLLPYAKRNSKSQPQEVGKEVVVVGKEVSAMLDQVMRRTMKMAIKKDGTANVDKMIAEMPDHVDDPNDVAMCKALIEARFGVKIEIGEDFNARSLPRIGKMLARVPEWQAKQTKKGPGGAAAEKSLKTFTYQTEPLAKGNYYSSSRKTIALQNITEKGSNDEHRLVSDSGKVVKTSYFDFTTLHEIGHAVDDRIKFMSGRMEKDGFGKWKKETFESVRNAFLPGLVTDLTGGTKKAQAADLEAMLTDLLKTGSCKKPANATDTLGSLFDEWDQIQNHAVVVKCKKGLYTKSDPWDKGKSHAEAVELGGRVYHEAYDNDWYSYAIADRAATGMTTYQWRAPGEWFAELYAMYYLNKLGRSHPMSSWFRKAGKSEEKAAKV